MGSRSPAPPPHASERWSLQCTLPCGHQKTTRLPVVSLVSKTLSLADCFSLLGFGAFLKALFSFQGVLSCLRFCSFISEHSDILLNALSWSLQVSGLLSLEGCLFPSCDLSFVLVSSRAQLSSLLPQDTYLGRGGREAGARAAGG